MRLTKQYVYDTMKADYTLFYKPMPEAWKKLFPVMTIQILEKCGFHFTTNHTGKMNGMISLSTTCKKNKSCQNKIMAALKIAVDKVESIKEARKALKRYIAKHPLDTNICICGFCFSDAQQDFQASMVGNLERNYDILNNGIIHDDWIPVLNCLYLRGESFGDFASLPAVINFYKIAEKNRGVNVTAWTKNIIHFINADKAGYKKPENFKLVFSAFCINNVPEVPEAAKHIIDAVFTVFTERYAKLHNIAINCGARACLACLRCYTNFDGIKYINELLK